MKGSINILITNESFFKLLPGSHFWNILVILLEKQILVEILMD